MTRPDEILRGLRKEAEDRRRLTGKFAPAPGVCRVCGGSVVADIGYPDDGRCGGPPRNCYVSGWHCSGCMIVYSQRPPEAKP